MKKVWLYLLNPKLKIKVMETFIFNFFIYHRVASYQESHSLFCKQVIISADKIEYLKNF